MDRPSTSKSRGICKYYTTPRGCFSGNNCKFLHGDPKVDKGADARLTPYDQSKTCRYYARGYCKRAEKCWFLHTQPLSQAGKPSGTQDDIDPIDENCSICFEKPGLYGLLAGCSHVFCITCLKQWRDPAAKSVDMVDAGVHKKCPMCRAPSSFITPSSLFYKNEDPRKEETIKVYKQSMAKVPCRYFQQSRAKNKAKPSCPFGKDCFYQHLNDDGTPYVFRDGVEVAMRKFRQQQRPPLFSHINLFADIFESVRREEDGNYEWINRLLEEPNLGQLQDTLQAVRDSLQQEMDRATSAAESRPRRDGTNPAQNDIVINASVLRGLEGWNLGERPSTSNTRVGPVSLTNSSLWRNVDLNLDRPLPLNVNGDGNGSDHGSLPPLQDVETTDSEGEWSTTDDESDEEDVPSQVDLNDLRRTGSLSFAFTISSHNVGSGPHTSGSIMDDDPPHLEPLSETDDDESGGLLALELLSDEESSEDDAWPRPPFVTDGRGRVIGASDGNNGSASDEARQADEGRGNAEDIPRTLLSRFMDAFR